MDERTEETATELSAVGLELPAEYDDAVETSAMRLDGLLDSRDFEASEFDPEAESVFTEHHDALHHQNDPFVILKPILLTWPNSWYIPTDADYKAHWPFPPPADRRYALDWENNSPPNRASKATGELYAWGQLWPQDRYVSSYAGVGVMVNSFPFSFGLITVRPTVACTAQTRWWQQLDQPVAGTTHTWTSIVVAIWEQTANGWEPHDSRSHVVHDGFVQSGSGHSAVRTTTREFKDDQLMTNFTAQGGRTYLVGVLARVSIRSTLTDSNGGPLPNVPNSEKFKIWGVLAAKVPRISVRIGPLHIF